MGPSFLFIRPLAFLRSGPLSFSRGGWLLPSGGSTVLVCSASSFSVCGALVFRRAKGSEQRKNLRVSFVCCSFPSFLSPFSSWPLLPVFWSSSSSVLLVSSRTSSSVALLSCAVFVCRVSGPCSLRSRTVLGSLFRRPVSSVYWFTCVPVPWFLWLYESRVSLLSTVGLPCLACPHCPRLQGPQLSPFPRCVPCSLVSLFPLCPSVSPLSPCSSCVPGP